MKLLLAVLVVVCTAGAVRGQAAGEACGPNNLCNPDLVCQNSTCRVKIGGTCADSSTDKCVLTANTCNDDYKCICVFDAAPTANNETCKCTDTRKIVKEDGSACVSKEGEVCAVDAHCLANAECSFHRCACKTGSMPTADRTKCLKNNGQGCMTQSECLTGADCTGAAGSKTCTCPNGVNTDNNKCLAKVDETCSVDSDCIAHTTCNSSRCMCKDSYLATYDMKACRKAPDQSCSVSNECGENAECKSSKCSCKTDFDYKDETERCGKKAGEVCDDNKDCVPNAECKTDTSDNKKKCTCTGSSEKDSNNFCSGAATAMISLLLMLAAFVITRWV